MTSWDGETNESVYERRSKGTCANRVCNVWFGRMDEKKYIEEV